MVAFETMALTAAEYGARALVDHMGSSNKRRRSSTGALTMLQNEDGANNVRPTVKRFGNKGRMRKHKPPTVSSKFKKAVAAASAPDKFHGTKTDRVYTVMSNIPKNQQLYNGWTDGVTGGFFGQRWSFLPEYYIDAVSCLFAGKTASKNNWSFQSTGTLDVGAPPVTSAFANALKFKVVDSWEKYIFKNNTPRVMIVKIYECSPKAPSYFGSNSGTFTGLTAAGALDAIVSPPAFWAKALTDENTNGLNLSNVNPTQLNLSPKGCPAFNKVFSSNVTDVVLEPGTVYEYFLQGPSDFNLDVAKMFDQTYFQNIQKFSRYVMPVVTTDLAGHTASTGGVNAYFNRGAHNNITTDGAVNAGNFLGYERTLHCKVEMPEATGFQNPATFVANAYNPLSYRRSPYIINTWDDAGDGTGVQHTEDMTQQTNVQAVE